MAFLPNIPQPTDQLSVSQGNLLNNFQILGAIAGNGNASSASINATSGFNWIYLPVQAGSPPAGAAFPAGTIGLYTFLNATTARNELYIQKKNPSAAGDIQIPMTATVQTNPGWTYLPSGIILQWGTVATVGGNNVVNFPIAFPGQCLTVVAGTAQNVGADSNTFVRVITFVAGSFTCWSSQRTTTANAATQVAYIAIGY